MSGSQTVPVVIVNTDHTFPWRVGAGQPCLLLALGAVLILGALW